MTPGQPVGVIGLGAMGGAVARRLGRQGFEVHVADRDPAAVQRATGWGAQASDVDAVFDLDQVVTSLPDDDVVLAVCTEDRLARLGRGLLIELSTILPETIRQIAARGAAAGTRLLDCPVSGGPDEAGDGTLVLFVGGEDSDITRARPVLDAIGSVQHVGGIGDGKALKLVNNAMGMGNMVVAAEAFVLGQRLGLDPKLMYEVLSRSGGASYHFAKRGPYILDDDFAPRFAVRLCEKDLRLALASAGSDYPMPVASLMRETYARAMAAGLADDDEAAVIKLFDGRATAGGSGA